MERFANKTVNNYNTNDYNSEERYTLAYKRVKEMKGFYIHAFVYFVVNAFILIIRFDKSAIGDANFLEWQTLNTVVFWGIGLVVHGVSVFGKDIIFGRNWEDKKIQEFMEKEKSEKWE
jgi:hypothetical protein